MILASLTAHPALAQDRIPKVEYQAGHAGMEKKVKGSLVITDAEVQFLDEKDTVTIVPHPPEVVEVATPVSQ
jgi:hypothetical protein